MNTPAVPKFNASLAKNIKDLTDCLTDFANKHPEAVIMLQSQKSKTDKETNPNQHSINVTFIFPNTTDTANPGDDVVH